MKAVLLFGHGSKDPAWRRPMDDVAQRIRQQAPGVPVACAFLELQAPDFQQAVDELVASGARVVQVLPMFLGVGKHAREDLPRLVVDARQRHPELSLAVLPSVGEHPEVLDHLARIALG
jgi:sirohydrochlorin cobaltochelatase